MITLTNVSNEYNGKTVLHNVNFDLPRYGLIGIQGPSGCGKSTLLHAICGLIDFKGKIIIDGNQVIGKSKAMEEFRLKNVGLIFQDFKLFENETALNNVFLPIDSISNSSYERKKNKCQDLLDLVGLKRQYNKTVKKMSGGEKQRVAIARAIVNDPKIILADEPTGSLDENNAKGIMNILSFLSKKTLVIIVSHDEELLRKYCDKIFLMKDGCISNTLYLQKSEVDRYIPIIKNRAEFKNPKLNNKFLIKYSSHCLSESKWRTILSVLISSIGLVGMGASVSLSDSLSKSIEKTYTSMIDSPKLVVSDKNSQESIVGKFAATMFEAIDLAEHYPQYINGVGCIYYSNMDTFFPDTDEFRVYNGNSYIEIDDLSVKNINEYLWLSDLEDNIYPSRPDILNNDEIILGLNMNNVEKICRHLFIPQNSQSLIDYISTNNLQICLVLKNSNWTYEDEFVFTVRGITIQKYPCFYHTDQFWNVNFFEDVAGFPTSDSLNKIDDKPWTLKKVYYLHCFGNIYSFLNDVYSSDLIDSKILELGNKQFFPNIIKNGDVVKKRILFFENHEKTIPFRYGNLIQSNVNGLSHPMFSNKGSYSIYPDALLIGFAKQIFFSSSNLNLEETIDLFTSTNIGTNEKLDLDEKVIEGGYYKQNDDGIRFENLEKEITLKENEVYISTALAQKLYGRNNCLDSILYVGYDNSTNSKNKNFIIKELIIKGLVDSLNYRIYQKPIWLITYFQNNFDISAFDLIPSAIFYDIDNANDAEKIIDDLTSKFPNFKIVNPLKDIYSDVRTICNKTQTFLILISVVSIIISFILLILCNYLHAIEKRKDIALARCLGISSKEACKFVRTHSLLLCFYSFISSLIEMVIISIFITFFLSKTLSLGFDFSLNPLSFILTFIVSFVAGLLSSYVASNEVKRLSPLVAIKK